MSLNELKMTDEVLAPKASIKINYDGPTPSAAINIIKTLGKKYFRVPSKFWYEDEFTFVDIGSKVELYAEWNARTKFDRYTKYRFRLIYHMFEDKKTKKGNFYLTIRPTIETKFSYRNVLERLFYLIFMKMFYYKQRRNYMDELKKWTLDFKEAMLNAFGTNVKEDLEGV